MYIDYKSNKVTVTRPGEKSDKDQRKCNAHSVNKFTNACMHKCFHLVTCN